MLSSCLVSSEIPFSNLNTLSVKYGSIDTQNYDKLDIYSSPNMMYTFNTQHIVTLCDGNVADGMNHNVLCCSLQDDGQQ